MYQLDSQGVDIDADTSHILVYDNSEPNDLAAYIEISRPVNRYILSTNDTYKGTAIYSIPLGVWRGENHLLLDIAGAVFGGVVGNANGLFTTPEGGRWGWQADGTEVDALPGAIALPSWSQTSDASAQSPVLLPTSSSAPDIEVNSKGGAYLFFAANGGQVFLLSSPAAQAGDTDHVALTYHQNELHSFRYRPQRDASGFSPRIGHVYGERERAVFSWEGITVPGGGSVQFESLKPEHGVAYHNQSGQATRLTLVVQSVDGASQAVGSYRFGPLNTPDGAMIHTTLPNWPDSSHLLLEIDQNDDGTMDESKIISGLPCRSLDTNGDGLPDTCGYSVLLPFVAR